MAGEIRLVPFELVVGGTRCVDLGGDAVATGRDLGICVGDEVEGWFPRRHAYVAAQ